MLLILCESHFTERFGVFFFPNASAGQKKFKPAAILYVVKQRTHTERVKTKCEQATKQTSSFFVPFCLDISRCSELSQSFHIIVTKRDRRGLKVQQ